MAAFNIQTNHCLDVLIMPIITVVVIQTQLRPVETVLLTVVKMFKVNHMLVWWADTSYVLSQGTHPASGCSTAGSFQPKFKI